jgi:large subunit ribosomal protein L33
VAKSKGKVKYAGMVCSSCGERGYVTVRNSMNHPDLLELKKFCKRERVHTVHKETKKNLGRNEA